MAFRAKFLVGLTLASVAVAAVSPAAAQRRDRAAAPTAPKIDYSRPFNGAATAAQKAIDAGERAAIVTALAAARAVATTDGDQYGIGLLLIQAGTKLNDAGLQKEGLATALASSAVPAEQRPQFGFFLGSILYGEKDFAGALQSLLAAYEAGHRGNDIEAVISDAALRSKDIPAARLWTDRAIAAKIAAGLPVDQSYYKRAASMALQVRDYAGTLGYLNRLVDASPTATNWRDTLSVYRDSRTLDNGDALDVLRLMRAAGAMRGQADYAAYVDFADARRLPAEVAAVLQEGAASSQLGSDSYFAEVRATATGRLAADRGTLPDSERDARSARDGRLALTTADAFMAHGDNIKAAELYALAVEKGGVDADRAHLRQGIALARANNKDAASAAFAKVQSEPKKDIAAYWTRYLTLGSAPG